MSFPSPISCAALISRCLMPAGRRLRTCGWYVGSDEVWRPCAHYHLVFTEAFTGPLRFDQSLELPRAEHHEVIVHVPKVVKQMSRLLNCERRIRIEPLRADFLPSSRNIAHSLLLTRWFEQSRNRILAEIFGTPRLRIAVNGSDRHTNLSQQAGAVAWPFVPRAGAP